MSNWNDHFKREDEVRKNGSGEFIFLMLDNIDAKASALLTHVSIMLGVSAILYTETAPSSVWRSVIAIEMLGYIAVAIACLTCVDIIGTSKSDTSASAFKERCLDTLNYRHSVYRWAWFFSVVLTACLAVTFLGHLAADDWLWLTAQS